VSTPLAPDAPAAIGRTLQAGGERLAAVQARSAPRPPERCREWLRWLVPDVVVPSYLVPRAALILVAQVAALTIPPTFSAVPAPLPQSVA